MPDYKESAVSGVLWHRFRRIVIDNPRLQAPSVTCLEEQVVSVDGVEQRRDVGALAFRFDPAAVFPVLDPETGESTGDTATGAQVYALIYGYVMSEPALILKVISRRKRPARSMLAGVAGYGYGSLTRSPS